MFEIVKNRYRLIRYRNCGGTYCLHNNETGQRVSLETKDKNRATELLVAHNESAREPAFNLQKARVSDADRDSRMEEWKRAGDYQTLSPLTCAGGNLLKSAAKIPKALRKTVSYQAIERLK